MLSKNAETCSGCRIYTTLFPCNECAKVIMQAGIKQVIFASDKQKEKLAAKASRRLFELANVELRQHVPEAELLHLPLHYTEEAKAAKAKEPLPQPLPPPLLPSQSAVTGPSAPRLGLSVDPTIACDSHGCSCGCGTTTGVDAVAPGCRLGTGAAAFCCFHRACCWLCTCRTTSNTRPAEADVSRTGVFNGGLKIRGLRHKNVSLPGMGASPRERRKKLCTQFLVNCLVGHLVS